MTEAIPSRQQRQHIVIAGDGHAAYMAASALVRAVNPEDYCITVVGISDAGAALGPFDIADATLPTQDRFLPAGLREDHVINQGSGSFTHGIALSGWANPNTSYFHPFGSIGAALGPVSFHQIAIRLRHAGVAVRLANYSLSALAAQAGRYVPPVNDPHSVLASCQHGLHLDCHRLADSLRAAAVDSGVLRVKGKFSHVEYAIDGDVSAIITHDGSRVEGDLFIDCTGKDALLAGTPTDAEWQDWSSWLPCDSLVSAIITTPQAPAPYSHNDTFEAGWIQHLPLQGRTILNGLYRADTHSEDQLLNKLLQSSGSTELQPVYTGPVHFGRRTNVWQRNCIALGTAAVLIDPVAITNLQLLGIGISRLLQLLPATRDTSAVCAEYNRQMAMQFDHARDFAIMHYKLNGRHGESFWDTCRTMPVAEELDYKLRLYQSRGRVPLYDEEPLEETSWLNLFDEHGISPRGYSTIAHGFSLENLQRHLQRVRAVMMDALPKIPLHADYLAYLRDIPVRADKTEGQTR